MCPLLIDCLEDVGFRNLLQGGTGRLPCPTYRQRHMPTLPDLAVARSPRQVQAQILGLLEALKRTRGLTYLLISHNLVVVHYMSDVVAVMYLGKIVEMARSAALFTSPLHPYSAALISAIRPL